MSDDGLMQNISNKKLILLVSIILLFSFASTYIQETSITGLQFVNTADQTTISNPTTPKLTPFQKLFGSNTNPKPSPVLQQPYSGSSGQIESLASDSTILHPQNNMAYNKKVLDLNVSSPKTIISWVYNLNNQGNITFSPNTTITGILGINKLTVYATDNTSNTTAESIQLIVDIRPPNILNQNKTPSIIYNDMNVTFSAIVFDKGAVGIAAGQFTVLSKFNASSNATEPSNVTNISTNNQTVLQVVPSIIIASAGLQTVWISSNWTGTWENFTVATHVGDFYYYTATVGNFSNQENVTWFFNANDTAGNSYSASMQSFIVQNRPPQPVTLIQQANASTLTTGLVFFNWSDGIDQDNDTLKYNLMVATNPLFTSLVINKTNITPSEYLLTTLEQLADSIYYWKVIASDGHAETPSGTFQFVVVTTKATTQAISFSLSRKLETGISWNVTTLPAVNLDAEGNNGTGITQYNAQVYSTGTKMDIYIKATGNLTTAGGDQIYLQNEKFSINMTNAFVPNSTKFSLTKNYTDNKIAFNISNGTFIHFKFFLNASASQPPGLYTNNVSIVVVPFDTPP